MGTVGLDSSLKAVNWSPMSVVVSNIVYDSLFTKGKWNGMNDCERLADCIGFCATRVVGGSDANVFSKLNHALALAAQYIQHDEILLLAASRVMRYGRKMQLLDDDEITIAKQLLHGAPVFA